jgi:hypothetical protein
MTPGQPGSSTNVHRFRPVIHRSSTSWLWVTGRPAGLSRAAPEGALPASDCDDFGASAVEIGCRRAVAAARAMAVRVEPCSIV